MTKTYYEEFKSKWLSTYKKQYIESNNTERREIRDNLYNNRHLSRKEKDLLWEKIVNGVWK